MTFWSLSSKRSATSWFAVLIFALSGCAKANSTSDDWLDELAYKNGTDPDGNQGNLGDACPNDPLKVKPGVCGCGVSDKDFDADGTFDCFDHCPNDPQKTDQGICGCGFPDKDYTGDGAPDCYDNCPDDPDKIDPGICGCGTPDNDSDKDGTPDCKDDCPQDPLGDVGTDRYPDCDNDGKASYISTPACSPSGASKYSPCLDGQAPDGGWSDTPGQDCDDEDSGNPCPCGEHILEGSCVELPKNCAELLADKPTSTDGIYLIDPDGPDEIEAFEVYCDMTNEGGGWTQIAHVHQEEGMPTPGCEATGGDPSTLGYSIDATGIAFTQIAVTHNGISEGWFASFTLKSQTTFDCSQSDIVFPQNDSRYSILRLSADSLDAKVDAPVACFNATNELCNFQDRNETYGVAASSVGGCQLLNEGDGTKITCGAWGLSPHQGDTTWSLYGGRIFIR